MKLGHLFIVAGPSGVGKNTIIRRLLENNPELFSQVPSFTTRPERRDDKINQNRITITNEEFQKLINNGELADWVTVHGYLYGKKKADIQSFLYDGKNVILEIDVKGLAPYKNQFKNSHSFFIKYQNIDQLRNRLKRAHQDINDAEIEIRYATAVEEMKQIDKYDYVIESDENDPAGIKPAAKIEEIIKKVLAN